MSCHSLPTGRHTSCALLPFLFICIVQSSVGDIIPPPECPHFQQAWVHHTRSVRCTSRSRRGTFVQRTRTWSGGTERRRTQSLRVVALRVRRTFSKVKPEESVDYVDEERSVSASYHRYPVSQKVSWWSGTWTHCTRDGRMSFFSTFFSH